MKWLASLLLLASLVLSQSAWAQSLDAQYLKLLGTIEEADTLNATGKVDAARAKYREAQITLATMKRSNPQWNAKAVAYRLNYVTGKIAELSRPAAAAEVTGSASTNSGVAGLSSGASAAGSVRLLDPGSEPRTVLRFQPASGEKQTVTLTATTAVGMTGLGAPGDLMRMPASKISATITPAAGSSRGEIRYQVIVEEAAVEDAGGLPAEMADAAKASIGAVKGLVIVGTMSDRGFSKSAETRSPAGADSQARAVMEQVKEMFAQSYFVLPEEPIGPGARWESKEKLRTQGMIVDQTTTYELVSVSGKTLTAKSTSVQSAADQKIPSPGMPQFNVDLVKMTGQGNSTLTIDLGRIMPVQATVEERTEAEVSTSLTPQTQSTTVTTESSLRIESK